MSCTSTIDVSELFSEWLEYKNISQDVVDPSLLPQMLAQDDVMIEIFQDIIRRELLTLKTSYQVQDEMDKDPSLMVFPKFRINPKRGMQLILTHRDVAEGLIHYPLFVLAPSSIEKESGIYRVVMTNGLKDPNLFSAPFVVGYTTVPILLKDFITLSHLAYNAAIFNRIKVPPNVKALSLFLLQWLRPNQPLNEDEVQDDAALIHKIFDMARRDLLTILPRGEDENEYKKFRLSLNAPRRFIIVDNKNPSTYLLLRLKQDETTLASDWRFTDGTYLEAPYKAGETTPQIWYSKALTLSEGKTLIPDYKPPIPSQYIQAPVLGAPRKKKHLPCGKNTCDLELEEVCVLPLSYTEQPSCKFYKQVSQPELARYYRNFPGYKTWLQENKRDKNSSKSLFDWQQRLLQDDFKGSTLDGYVLFSEQPSPFVPKFKSFDQDEKIIKSFVSSLKATGIKTAVFDFDKTLSTAHLYNELRNLGYSAPLSQLDEDKAYREAASSYPMTAIAKGLLQELHDQGINIAVASFGDPWLSGSHDTIVGDSLIRHYLLYNGFNPSFVASVPILSLYPEIEAQTDLGSVRVLYTFGKEASKTWDNHKTEANKWSLLRVLASRYGPLEHLPLILFDDSYENVARPLPPEDAPLESEIMFPGIHVSVPGIGLDDLSPLPQS